MNRLVCGIGCLISVSLAAACGKSSAPLPGTPDATLTISGTASEAAPFAHGLAGVRVQVTDGPDAGLAATTDAGGFFRLAALKPGDIGLVATKDGYLAWRVLNLSVATYPQIQIVLYPVAPTDASGVPATARCNDGTWSWETSEAGLCSAHDGPAYTVCPGPLCIGRRSSEVR